MRLKFTGQYKHNPEYIIRRCSYGQILDSRTGRVSYVRRIGAGLYPRFHVYLDKEEDGVQINLHLDQKKASYKGSYAHSGEYDSELVIKEGERIKRWFDSLKM